MLRIPGASSLLRACALPRVTPNRGRKTRNDPPAKSKAGRIKYPPMVDAQELLNVRSRYRSYSLLLTALRSEFKREWLQTRREQAVGSLAEQRHQQEREEHAALMAWNQEENRKALQRRMERLRLEEAAFQLQRDAINRLHEETRLQEAQQRHRDVQLLQELSQTFITPENLEERIEAALDNPKSYNFCLDREGRVLLPTGQSRGPSSQSDAGSV